MKTESNRRVSAHYWQPETVAHAAKVSLKTVSGQAHDRGINGVEPLIVMMDALIRYAKAHQKRFQSELAEDYVLGPLWLNAAKGVRGLLNGDGALAHEEGWNTDSKDNGAVEGMFWDAMALAGFKEEEL